MPKTFRCRALLGAAALLGLLVTALPASAIPSAVVHYGPSLPASLDSYAAPGNVIVVTAQQRIRNPDRLRAWRARGAIVMAYVNLVDHRQPYENETIEYDLYGGAFPSAWKYPGNPSNWSGTTLLNLSASSPVATYNNFTGTWGQYAARWIRERVIGDGSIFNGVFLDVWGDTVWSLGIGGAGSDWEAGIARWGAEIRAAVGSGIYLVGNNSQTPRTAGPLNGRMWESFNTGSGSGWNQLDGPNNGLVQTFRWPQWHRPQLDILWRNEANPSAATMNMLNDAAARVTATNTDIAVGSSDHRGGFPAPFGRGGGRAPGTPVIPGNPPHGGAPAPGGGGTGAPGGAGGQSDPGESANSLGERRANTLLRSEFARGRTAGWKLQLGPRSRVRRDAAALTLMAGRSPASRALLWRAVRAEATLRVDARVRLRSVRLPVGRARPLLAVAAPNGARREAGLVRGSDRRLHWATWTVTPRGKRTGMTVARARARLGGGWMRLRLDTDWSSRAGTDRLAVRGTGVVRARAGQLGAKRAARVGIGAGPSKARGGSTAISVHSVRVSTR